jgi:hypothetical protein
MVRTFFGDRFGGKEDGLLAYKPSSEELGDCSHLCSKSLRNFNFFPKFEIKIKKLKTKSY